MGQLNSIDMRMRESLKSRYLDAVLHRGWWRRLFHILTRIRGSPPNASSLKFCSVSTHLIKHFFNFPPCWRNTMIFPDLFSKILTVTSGSRKLLSCRDTLMHQLIQFIVQARWRSSSFSTEIITDSPNWCASQLQRPSCAHPSLFLFHFPVRRGAFKQTRLCNTAK